MIYYEVVHQVVVLASNFHTFWSYFIIGMCSYYGACGLLLGACGLARVALALAACFH